MPEPTTFAILLRRHRLARSLTQEQLAERAGVTAKAVGALERGERRRPYPHTVRSLARALALGDGERAELENAVPFRIAPRREVTPPRSPATQDRDLPAPHGPVLGREDEVDLVSDLLRAGERRLITLVGTGGAGRTTLALAALAATLEWSLALLGNPARSLLGRLSVCVGGFSLRTVEEVGVDTPDVVLAALSELLEQSLVTRMPDLEGTERFRLLDPVRQHAANQLTPAERDAARSTLAATRDTARSRPDDLRGAGRITARPQRGVPRTVGAGVGGSEPAEP